MAQQNIIKVPTELSANGSQEQIKTSSQAGTQASTQTGSVAQVNSEASPVNGKKTALLGGAQIVIIFVIFYFFLIKPQKKRINQEQAMRGRLKIGDKVSTTSGIFGVIKEIDQVKELVSIEIAKGVKILMYRDSVKEVLTSLPTSDFKDKASSEAKEKKQSIKEVKLSEKQTDSRGKGTSESTTANKDALEPSSVLTDIVEMDNIKSVDSGKDKSKEDKTTEDKTKEDKEKKDK